MTIDGLTAEQVKLLDAMWSLETADELASWMQTLSPSMTMQAMVLRDLLLLSGIDDDIELVDTYPEAEKMLKKIGI